MPSRPRKRKFVRTIGFRIAARYSVLFALSFLILSVLAYLLLGAALVRQDRELVGNELESLRGQHQSGGWAAFRETVIENNRFRKNNPFFTRMLDAQNRTREVFFPHHWKEFDLEALERMPLIPPGSGSTCRTAQATTHWRSSPPAFPTAASIRWASAPRTGRPCCAASKRPSWRFRSL